MRSLYNLLKGEKKPSFVPVLVIPVINIKRVIRVIGDILVGLVFIVSPLLFVWTVALVPGSSIEKTIISIEETIKFDLRRSVAGCFFKDWWKEYEDNLFPCDFLEGERFINIPDTIISLRDPPPEIVGAIIHTTDDLTPRIPCEHVGVLNLSSRLLNYANFSSSAFICVKMVRTQLNNSRLTGASLEGANLAQAMLNRARLSEAKLSEADLYMVELVGADLSLRSAPEGLI